MLSVERILTAGAKGCKKKQPGVATPSEKVAMGERIEEYECEEAKRRQ